MFQILFSSSLFFCCLFNVSAESISIVGSNYVGLVTAAIFARSGHDVTCLDIDRNKIAQLDQRKMPLYEPKLAQFLFEGESSARIQFSADITNSIDAPIIYICVGTPTTPEGTFDMSYIYSAMDSVLMYAPHVKVVCVKSTVQPGTHAKLKEYLRSKNRSDILLVYNPEFMREGSAIDDILYKNPLVIGGDSQQGLDIIQELYQSMINQYNLRIIKTSFETAELIKYAWNSFSALRISYINELSQLCQKIHADIFTVIKAIALSEYLLPTDVLKPGPGIGGSCLPKDTLAFVSLLEKNGFANSLIHQAISSNQQHKHMIMESILSLLENEPKNKVVSILGLSFKAHTDDIRYAPSLDIIKELKEKGVIIKAYDPQAMPNMQKLFPDIIYCSSPYEAAESSHCVVVLTEWPEIEAIDLDRLASVCSNRVLFDTKNLYDPLILKQYGFITSNLGRM